MNSEKVAPTITTCDCTMLEEVIEWIMNECFGYECPSSRYFCTHCGRHYKTPPIADLELQQSEGGKNHVSDWIRFRQEEHARKVKSIKDQVGRLVEALKEMPPEEKQQLLAPLSL